MIITLVGVLEVGGPRAPGVPVNTRATLHLVQGADTKIRVRVIRSDGTAFPVEQASITLNIRKRTTDVPAVSKEALPEFANGPGWCCFSLDPADTINLLAGAYVYDVWLDQPGTAQHDPIISLSACLLEPTATSVPA